LRLILQFFKKNMAEMKTTQYEMIITNEEFETCLNIRFSSSGGMLVLKLNSSYIKSSLPIKNLILIAPSHAIAKMQIKNKNILAFLFNNRKITFLTVNINSEKF